MMEWETLSAWQDTNGTLLHLGAGECRELEVYLNTQAKRIVLVEADPQVAQALRRRTQSESRVQVIEAAVAEKSGKATLYRYNLKGLTTLYPFTSSSSRWPGLRLESELTIQAISFSQLLEQLALEEDKAHWLVIDAPGVEAQLLKALAGQVPTQRFSYLSLHSSRFVSGDQSAWPALRQTMEKANYRLEDVTGYGSQRISHAGIVENWIVSCQLGKEKQRAEELQASCDNMLQESQQLKQQLAEAEQALSKQKHQVEELQAARGSLQHENRQLKAENEEIQQRQALLEEELRKAEVQLELIKELFLSKEDAEQLETKERDA
ncbi:FkbM family methyltransferase [Halomonas ramblicola]|uniref:FkbM family methyltransferase n=1 Tax=Halomonas ramblicola TaxID=747349 RepID=UPI0025B49BD2|nr:FkbM family methyltransferase [Halomonas ramblicola]MDN3522095.1 FkbM family methyltransferase [Halomonas ramblicola]